jgi:GH18 family chitinase
MKIDFAIEKGLRGIFYWEYGYDNERILRFLTEGE